MAAIVGKFLYPSAIKGKKAEGKLVMKDVLAGDNLTEIILDFGTDGKAVARMDDRVFKMESSVCRELGGFLPALSAWAVNFKRKKVILLRGHSFNGTPLPERKELDLEQAKIIFRQIQRFLPVELGAVEVYPFFNCAL